MELITGLFILGLYKATERIWDKGFDAAWTPVDEALKARFTRWAGKGKETERKAAFEKAAKIARANTLRTAADPQQAERILGALDGERDKKGAKALAEEGAKLMLFSVTPDVPRLTRLCQERLHWDAVWGEGELPAVETVAVTLSDFLTNLREALLDQEPYHDLVQKDMRRALNEILAELRPVAHDDEATYRSQMAEMYRQLEFVGIPELKERRPVTVEDIFIHLRVETPDYGSFVRDPLTGGIKLIVRTIVIGIEAELREFDRVSTGWTERQLGIDAIIRNTARLVILGDPGAGKTTLLKYLTVICAEGRDEAELGLKADSTGSLLPVFIPLREFAAECAKRAQDYCLLDYLYTHAREHLMLNLRQGFFEDALEAGRCLVCLDGLDEVWTVGQRKVVADAVRALAARFPRSRYIVTSRIVGYDEAPLDRRDFVHHTVLPLTNDDIREFVRKWYEARERDPVQRKQKADDLIATIEREPRIRTLAENPLLLTIIALVHRIEAELPHERVKLYDKCVTALVDTWEEVKGLTIEEKQRPFYRQRRRLLERLAYELHVQAEKPGQLQTIKVGDLELLLTRFLMENRRLGLADDPDAARDEARAFIRLARGRTGLLVERGEGVFGFPHLTFQEYLAASDIETRCMPYGVDAVWKEIKDHLHDSHWREVILLLLGSLNRYEDAPTLLMERILEAGEEDKFEPVLHRCLYLAARVLADRVDVANDLRRRVVDNLVEIARIAPLWERDDAFSTLSQLGGDCYVIDVLLAVAHDRLMDANVRCTAASALGRLGYAGEAMEVLLAMACDEQVDTGVRSKAAQALGRLGHAGETAEILLANNLEVDVWVRYAAASALGQMGQTGEAAKVLLALALDEQVDAGVRYVAISALGQLGRAEEEVLDSLLTLAWDEQAISWLRSAVAFTLDNLGHTEKAADVWLVLACNAQVDVEERCEAASALGQLGRAEEKMLDSLLILASDTQVNAKVRREAASTLGNLGRVAEAAKVLLILASDTQINAEVRYEAASALGQLSNAEEARSIMLTLAQDEQVDTEVRSDAINSLSVLLNIQGCADEKVLDSLLSLARDEQVNVRVRGAAASAMGHLGRVREAVEILLVLAHDEQVDAEVHNDTADALSYLGRIKEAVDVWLALACDRQVDARIQRTAAQTLGQLGRDNERVLNGLLALARDTQVDAEVRDDAYNSLKLLVGGATANSE